MTFRFPRHALSALAALALVSVVAGGAMAGDTRDTRMPAQERALPTLDMVIVGQKLETKKPAPGLTAEKGQKVITSIISGFNSLER